MQTVYEEHAIMMNLGRVWTNIFQSNRDRN